MHLEDITADTEAAFFTCLHLEEPENREHTVHSRSWYAKYRDKGYRARVLRLVDGSVVGKCHSIPIDHSPFVGKDLLAILCLYVHLYEHLVGDQRGRGHGRFMLGQIEQEARSAGFKGVVAWAMDWEVWNPVSFFEHLGYKRADQEGKVVAVWKPFSDEARQPRLLRMESPPVAEDSGRVSVLVADNPWCDSNYKLTTARAAIQGIEHLVDFREVSAPCRNRILHIGHVGGVFLDGTPYRPYQVMGDSDELRAEIIRLHGLKQR